MRRRTRRRYQAKPAHDRRASVLPINAAVRAVTVDDPYEAGGKIVALASLRDDPLGRLHAHRQIDEAQYYAGRHLQALYEAAEVSPIRAMDTTKEPVDGGGSTPELLTDRQRNAIKEIGRIERALGMHASALLRDFLTRRMSIRDCAASRGITADREIRAIGAGIRQALEGAAEEAGYA